MKFQEIENESTLGGRMKLVVKYVTTGNKKEILERFGKIISSPEKWILGKNLNSSENDCKPLRKGYNILKTTNELTTVVGSPTSYFESLMSFTVRIFLTKIVPLWAILGIIYPPFVPVFAISSDIGDVLTWTEIINWHLAMYLAMSIDFNKWIKDGHPLPPLETRIIAILVITFFLKTSESRFEG